MAAIVPPQLKVVFDSPRYSGEQVFDKNPKGTASCLRFLKNLRQQHAQRKNGERLTVQIATI